MQPWPDPRQGGPPVHDWRSQDQRRVSVAPAGGLYAESMQPGPHAPMRQADYTQHHWQPYHDRSRSWSGVQSAPPPSFARAPEYGPYAGRPPLTRPPLGQSISYPPRAAVMDYRQETVPPLDHPYETQAGPSTSSSSRPGAAGFSGHTSAYHPYSPPIVAPQPRKQLMFIDSSDGEPVTGKPKRKRITPDQLEHLLALFNQTDSPTFDAREKVARLTNMTNREVQVWFQNRRAKVIRERERERLRGETGKPGKGRKSGADAGRAPHPSDKNRASTRNGSEEAMYDRHTASPAMSVTSTVPPSDTASPPPISHLPLASAPSEAMPPPSSAYNPRPQPSPHSLSATLSSRPSFGRTIDIPSPALPSLSPHGGTQPLRSPSGVPYSPSAPYGQSYFAWPSPSLASSYSGSHMFTPNPGSAYSAASSYFSHNEPGLYSPSTTFSSPSGNFFRLTLDSPGCFSPRSAVGQQLERSPSTVDPPIQLAPIVSPGLWGPQGSPKEVKSEGAQDDGEERAMSIANNENVRAHGHQRSRSDTTAAIDQRIDNVRSTASAGVRVAVTSASTPNSPTMSSKANQDSINARASFASVPPSAGMPVHVNRAQYVARRRVGPRPSSLSNISPSIAEETTPPPPSATAEGIGLGMLAMAGELVTGEEDPEERAARERYLATRKLSYNAGAHDVEMAGQ